MAVPVIPLPIDRLAGQRPAARAEQRPVDRDGAAFGQAAVSEAGSFDASDRSQRAGATVTKLGDHLGQRRAGHRAGPEQNRSTQPQPDASHHAAAKAAFQPGNADAAQRIAQIVGRTANLAFQAQLISQNTPSPSSQPVGSQASQRYVEAANAAYRRRQGTQDAAPLIEPHRPVDLIL